MWDTAYCCRGNFSVAAICVLCMITLRWPDPLIKLFVASCCVQSASKYLILRCYQLWTVRRKERVCFASAERVRLSMPSSYSFNGLYVDCDLVNVTCSELRWFDDLCNYNYYYYYELWPACHCESLYCMHCIYTV